MSKPTETNENQEIKEYADGWITERKGTDAPSFLKFAYIIIAGGAVAYLLMFMNGEVSHADRGPLVQAFNAATTSASTLMYFIAGIGIVYAITLVAFVFKKFHEEGE